MWRFVVATLEMKRFQDDAHCKKDVFHREKKIINDDDDDNDVDDDVNYEEITAPLIHSYIKNQWTFKNYLGQYLLGDSSY